MIGDRSDQWKAVQRAIKSLCVIDLGNQAEIGQSHAIVVTEFSHAGGFKGLFQGGKALFYPMSIPLQFFFLAATKFAAQVFQDPQVVQGMGIHCDLVGKAAHSRLANRIPGKSFIVAGRSSLSQADTEITGFVGRCRVGK